MGNLKRFWLNLCAMLVFLVQCAFSQSYNFKMFSVEDGLPRSEVRAIFQDKDNFLWVGTAGGGLARFDGKTFKVINTRNGLVDNTVNAIYQDKKGVLWVATERGISSINGQVIKSYILKGLAVANDFVQIIQDSKGTLWFRTFEKGVAYLLPNSETLEYLNPSGNNQDEVVFDMLEDKNGNMWFATKGITRLPLNSFPSKLAIEHHDLQKELGCNQVSSLIADKKGQLWLGTWGCGLVAAHVKGSKYLFKKPEHKGVMGSDIVLNIAIDDNNVIWTATLGNGVESFDGKVFKSYTSGQLQSRDNATKVFVDSYGNIWYVGSDESLFRLTPILKGTYRLTSYGVSNNMPDNHVKALFEDKEHNIWMGTANAGVLKYSGDAFYFISQNNGLRNNRVQGILASSGRTIVMGSAGGGLEFFTLKEDALLHKQQNIDPSSKNYINSITQVKDGSLWVSTNDFGVLQYSINGTLHTTLNKRTGMNSNQVWNAFEDKKGRLWIATNAGISLYHNKELKHILKLDKDDKEAITSVVEDSLGNIWLFGTEKRLWKVVSNKSPVEFTLPYRLSGCGFIYKKQLLLGTESDGIIKIDVNAEKPIAEIYLSSKQLKQAAVQSIIEDSEGNLWIGTTNGIYRYVPSKTVGQIERFGRADGLVSVVCNRNAVSRYNDAIWFGTVGGAIGVNTDKLENNKPTPEVYITGASFLYEAESIADYASRLDSSSLLPVQLKLPYRKNNINIEFIAPYYSTTDKIQYFYKLEGQDKNWLPVGNLNFAHFNNIPAGKYTFRVIAANSNGQFSKRAANFSFIVLPPFWQRTWFILLSVFIIITSFYSYYRWRVSNIRQRETLQRRIIETEQKALRAQMNPHFIFNSLNSIQYFITDKDVVSANKYLSKFSKLMRLILDNSRKPHISIAEEINALNLYMELESLRFEHKFDYRIDIASDVDVNSTEIPPLIIQPYLENAIWHGFSNKNVKGLIVLSIYHENEEILICEIIDNGIGRKRSLELKIEHPAHKTSSGMKITSDRILALSDGKGHVDVIDLYDETGIGIGTKVKIYISI